MAAERLAKLAPEMRSPAWTSGRLNLSAPAGWNFGSSLGAAPSVWLRAFEEPTEAMEPAAASGSAAMKERRRKVFSWVGRNDDDESLRYSIYQGIECPVKQFDPRFKVGLDIPRNSFSRGELFSMVWHYQM
jgi:hypothetical protein